MLLASIATQAEQKTSNRKYSSLDTAETSIRTGPSEQPRVLVDTKPVVTGKKDRKPEPVLTVLKIHGI